MNSKQLFIMSSAMLLIHSPTWAASKDQLTKIAPGTKVVKEDGDEYQVMTPKNTLIDVELNNDGTIDNASGTAAENGDVLNPGNGLMTLSAAVGALKKSGKKAVGEWSLNKSMTNGWVYNFQGVEKDKKMEYTVSATTGRIIESDKE